MSYHDPVRVPVADTNVRQALEEIRRQLVELAKDLAFRDIDVILPAGVNTVVHHGLGRRSLHYTLSAPRGATTTGRIDETAFDDVSVTLKATGMGATIKVRVRFW